MKNNLLIILAIIFIIICLSCAIIIDKQSQKIQLQKENAEYEKYINKEIKGTELATLIGKAVEQNETNYVPKDEKGYYINNNENSIKIDLKMVTVEKTYPMEEIYNNQIVNFVQNFNTINFKCTNIEYHSKTDKVAKLVFEEQQ